MALKVYVFGSGTLSMTPNLMAQTIEAWIQQTNGDIEFFVGGSNNFDAAVQKTIASLGGMHKTKVVGNKIRHNLYEMEEVLLDGEYKPDNKTLTLRGLTGKVEEIYYDIADDDALNKILSNTKYTKFPCKQMAKACDVALYAFNTQNKSMDDTVTTLKLLNKPVYIFQV